jgi:hypothetical protein
MNDYEIDQIVEMFGGIKIIDLVQEQLEVTSEAYLEEIE